MQYQNNLVIPPLTTKANPVTATLLLDVGTLDYIDLRFPDGCVGLVHFIAKTKGYQLIPWNQDGDLASNDIAIHSQLDMEIDQPPMDIKLIAWSEDDTYTHTLLCLTTWTPKGVVSVKNLLMKG